MSQEIRCNRIIVVDDERDIVQAYVDFLTFDAKQPQRLSSRSAKAVGAAPTGTVAEVYEILKAYSGEEAIALFKAELAAGRSIAGGFFDVKMDGGMDGIQTVAELFKLDPRLQVTIVTAYQDRSVHDIDGIFGTGFKDQWDYLNKPFNSGEIIQKARHMTAAWARRQGLERALRELKDTQAKLVESERMAAIGQVARGVGHEFGNILQRIVGKADLLLVATELDKAKAHAEVIMQAAEQAAVIVQNLQSFSKQQKERTEVSLSKIATGTLTLVNHEFVRRGIKLQNGLTPVPAVMGNAVELGQVVMNLIINAMDAMESSVVKNLEIGSRQQDGYVELWVKDSGTGIAPDVLPHIFEYAFTTKGDRGSGLGLAISKKIVESHGGELLCVSQAKQSTAAQGTQFTVKMPVVKGVGAP